MNEQVKLSKGIDWLMVWFYIILVSIGLLCIFSVEYHHSDNIIRNLTGLKKNYARQTLFIGLSTVIAIFILLTDSKFFTATANLGYALGILLLLATFVLGKDIMVPGPGYHSVFLICNPWKLAKYLQHLLLQNIYQGLKLISQNHDRN